MLTLRCQRGAMLQSVAADGAILLLLLTDMLILMALRALMLLRARALLHDVAEVTITICAICYDMIRYVTLSILRYYAVMLLLRHCRVTDLRRYFIAIMSALLRRRVMICAAAAFDITRQRRCYEGAVT